VVFVLVLFVSLLLVLDVVR